MSPRLDQFLDRAADHIGERFGDIGLGVVVVFDVLGQLRLIGLAEQRFDVFTERKDTGQRRRAGVDESASRIGHRPPCHIGRRLEVVIFSPPLAMDAACFLESSRKVDRLGVLAGGLPVRLDHGMDRVWPDWHGDGLGDVRGLCGSGKGAGTDDARDGRSGEETAPGWIARREHYGVVDCRRVCGWRDIHAVSPGHLDRRPFWLGLEPGRKLPLPLGLPL
jgi:hypothetical protein